MHGFLLVAKKKKSLTKKKKKSLTKEVRTAEVPQFFSEKL